MMLVCFFSGDNSARINIYTLRWQELFLIAGKPAHLCENIQAEDFRNSLKNAF